MKYGYGELPSEILDVIFKFIRLDENLVHLCQCVLVCKNWKLPAQRSLYSKICFTNPQAVRLIISANDIECKSFPGRFTRVIDYDGYLETREVQTSWINLFMDMFPHLRQIDLGKNDAWYYKALRNVFQQGKWTEMESIGTCSAESFDMHNACALLRRETLIFLDIYEGYNTKGLYSLYKKLDLFPNVKHLHFGTNKYSFFDTAENVQNMQNLQHLSFENLEGTVFNSVAPVEYIDLSTITPQPNIKQLTLQGISYGNDNFLSYLMKKFPRLHYLKINPGRGMVVSHGPLMEKIKSEKNNFTVLVLAQFMAFVSKCYIHSIDFFYTTLKTEDILKAFWSLCNPKEIKQLVIAYSEGLEWLSSGAEFDNSDSLVHIRLHVDSLTRKKAVALNYKFSKISLPHLRVIETNGAAIERLVIRFGPKKILSMIEDSDDKMLDMIEGYFFSHIIRHCVKLKTLHITLAHILILSPEFFFNRSITNLELAYVGISDTVLSEISRRIPNLRRLVLKDIHLITNEGDYANPNFYSIFDMPLSSFRFLHIENYTLDGLSKNEYPTIILIKLTTVQGERFYKHAPIGEIIYTGRNTEETSSNEKNKLKDTVYPRAIKIDGEEYYNGLGSKNCANLHVLCNSVNYLEVSLKKVNPLLACCIVSPDWENDACFEDDTKQRSYYMEFSS